MAQVSTGVRETCEHATTTTVPPTQVEKQLDNTQAKLEEERSRSKALTAEVGQLQTTLVHQDRLVKARNWFKR